MKYLVNKKRYRSEVLIAAGLATGNEKDFMTVFGGRIMFPLLDISGRIVGFSGRVLPGAKEDEAKYINSPETEIYHKSKNAFRSDGGAGGNKEEKPGSVGGRRIGHD